MESFRDTKGVILPRYTIGPEAYGALARVLAPLGTRILLIGGEKALHEGLHAFEQAIDKTALNLYEVVTYAGHCTLKDAKAFAVKAKEAGVQIIAGMGGGKAIDTAKACAHFAGLPVVTLPTIAATCAAVTALSVLYNEDGSFDEFLFLKAPPDHAFIHTGIIASAPYKYLRAGMGDSIAKHFESTFSARGDVLGFTDNLGLAISKTCYEPLLKVGEQALHDCEKNVDSQALREAVQSNIVSTGLVSLLVKDCYNGALAHSLFYAVESLPEIAGKCLHGDVVAYGVLVQLFMDGQIEKVSEVYNFLESLGVPVSFAAMGVDLTSPAFCRALDIIPNQPDMKHLPYTATVQMVRDAVMMAEKYVAKHTDMGGLKVV
jgi:glycerol dehydrogenase